MKRLLLFLSILLVPIACIAAQSSIVYSKATIRIVPAPGTLAPQPASVTDAAKKPPIAGDKAKDAKATSVPVARTTKVLSVEVRPVAILSQREFIVHEPFSDTKGLLLLVDPPDALTLKAAPLLGKADILMVTADGMIAKIAPNLTLNELDEPIEAGTKLRALVLLKAGLAEAADIQPGDKVQGGLFKTHPVVLESSHSPVIIDNGPAPDTQEPEKKRAKKPEPEPVTPPAAEIAYPLSSAPPAQSQQLMQELQK